MSLIICDSSKNYIVTFFRQIFNYGYLRKNTYMAIQMSTGDNIIDSNKQLVN